MNTHHTKSFTLIELLIVIVIIGILAVALIPRLTGSQARARDIARKADIRTIQTALAMYAAENNGNYPVSPPWCIGYNDDQSCRLGYTRRDPDNTSGFSGNSTLNALLLKYLNTIPLDPLRGRNIGDSYIYFNGSTYPTQIHCNNDEVIIGKPFLVRQPDEIQPGNDSVCAPGKYACCSRLGCTSFTSRSITYCVLQLDE